MRIAEGCVATSALSALRVEPGAESFAGAWLSFR